jgi:hypothetical protein
MRNGKIFKSAELLELRLASQFKIGVIYLATFINTSHLATQFAAYKPYD